MNSFVEVHAAQPGMFLGQQAGFVPVTSQPDEPGFIEFRPRQSLEWKNQ